MVDHAKMEMVRYTVTMKLVTVMIISMVIKTYGYHDTMKKHN